MVATTARQQQRHGSGSSMPAACQRHSSDRGEIWQQRGGDVAAAQRQDREPSEARRLQLGMANRANTKPPPTVLLSSDVSTKGILGDPAFMPPPISPTSRNQPRKTIPEHGRPAGMLLNRKAGNAKLFCKRPARRTTSNSYKRFWCGAFPQALLEFHRFLSHQ